MPLPILLWGAAAALTATGVFKGVKAYNNFDEAKRVGENAEWRHKQALEDLETSRVDTQNALESLGELKVRTFTHQIKYLVEAIKRSKAAKSTLKDFSEGVEPERKVKEYESLILKSLEIEKGIGAGAVGGALAAMGAYGAVGTLATASTGAAISGLSGAAATNATLAWLGGGALSAGGFGMAGGMIALWGIALGPALAIGGFIVASKSEEALTKAREYEANVDTSIEKIKAAMLMLKGIRSSAAELAAIIIELAERFERVKVPDATDERKFGIMLSVGTNLKKALDVSVVDDKGAAVAGITSRYSGLLQVN